MKEIVTLDIILYGSYSGREIMAATIATVVDIQDCGEANMVFGNDTSVIVARPGESPGTVI